MAENNSSDITSLTVQLLSAFVSKNEVSSDGLADLIKTTRAALMEDLAAPLPAPEPEYTPAVSVRKSLASPDHILSLIDGKPYKTLKRHLSANGLTEKEYRERYNLPASYPMVAPNYSQMRRAVAESNGLGKKSVAPSVGPAAAVESAPAEATPVTAKKAPAKVPTKKTSGKGAAVKTAPIVAAATSPAASAPAQRKKLSMFGGKSKDAPSSSTPNGEEAGAANSAAPAERPKAAKKAPAKAKRTANPKSLKSALKAAGAHLGNSADKRSDEPPA